MFLKHYLTLYCKTTYHNAPLKDFQIRQLLERTELQQFRNDGHSKVVPEMKIPVAGARIDIAVINGSFHGYEIKGASDTLRRLPNQLIAYSYIFDYLTIVTEEKHYKKVIDLVPEWIAVAICEVNDGVPHFIVKRHCSPNQNKQKFHIAKLLWHDELVEVLVEQNISCKKQSRNWILCETLSANLELDVLSEIVREKIKNREGWKL